MSTITRAEWEALPDIFVRLEKDEIGYPPKNWEQLKAEITETAGVYKIKSIPHYAHGLALDDVVSVKASPEGYYPVVDSVIERSGYSTMRLIISDEEDRDELTRDFTGHGCALEFSGSLVAIAIPRESLDLVSAYIWAAKDSGRWDAEDGFYIDEGELETD
jgi:hypothetical protein